MLVIIEINNPVHMVPPNHNLIATLIKKTGVASLWYVPGSELHWVIGLGRLIVLLW